MANLDVHNTRAWNDEHPAPGYMLDDVHQDARGNASVTRDLTPRKVIKEYLDNNPYGQKHGRVHHRARPLRESVVVCTADTTSKDVEKLLDTLEEELGVRCMYGHLHRDEGYLDKETGRPVRNYHIHVGYTNLVAGKLMHMDRKKMQQMQDVCASVLKMERGTPAKTTGRVHRERREHVQYLQQQAVIETAQKKTRELGTELIQLKERNQALAIENVELNSELATTHAAQQADAEALERLKRDPDLNLGPGLKTVEDLTTRLVETNRDLRQRIKDAGVGTPAIYKELKAIKTSDKPLPERLADMTKYVDKLLREYSPAVPTGAQRTSLGVPFNTRQRTPPPSTFHQALERERKWGKAQHAALGELNRAVRQFLIESGVARQADYQGWKKVLNDPDRTKQEKREAAIELLDDVRNRLVVAEAMNAVYRPLQDYCQARGISEKDIVEDIVTALEQQEQETFREHNLPPASTSSAEQASAAAPAEEPGGGGLGGPLLETHDSLVGHAAGPTKSWWDDEEKKKSRRRKQRIPGD